MLQLRQIDLRRGTRLLLEAADLSVYPGQKVGLVGANGCGKSSLFALIQGELHPDAGEVLVPAGWEIAHVAQQTPSGDQPAIELVMDGDQELRQVQRDLVAAEAAGDGLRQGELHARLEAIGGYTAESRAARLLHGLGFNPGEERRPVSSWSGGWRMRLGLARTLMCRSDLMLLDEPTNHLDLDAVIWLETWLRNYPGTLLLISHDRDFPGHHRPPDCPHRAGPTEFLHRQLQRLRGPARRTPEPAPGRLRPPAAGDQPHPGLRRALPRQGHQGPPGPEPHQGPGAHGAHRPGPCR
jgi:ATP-binding cassette subfamily F protein 3